MGCVNHLTPVQRLKGKSIEDSYSYKNLLKHTQYKICRMGHQKEKRGVKG